MGKRKVLLPAAMLLSALSALAGMLPYILIWLIVRELLEHGEITSSGNVVTYAWWAAGMAVASIVLRSEERRVGKECRSRWSPYH